MLKKEQPSGFADQKLQELVDEAAILTKEHGTADMFREYADKLENYFKAERD